MAARQACGVAGLVVAVNDLLEALDPATRFRHQPPGPPCGWTDEPVRLSLNRRAARLDEVVTVCVFRVRLDDAPVTGRGCGVGGQRDTIGGNGLVARVRGGGQPDRGPCWAVECLPVQKYLADY